MVYDELIDRVGLGDIRDKVLAGERLQADDGLRLYACDELPILGYLANIVRERKNGAATYYVRNQHINYTNVCNKLCKFCSFYVKPKDERGYVLSPEQVAARVTDYAEAPITPYQPEDRGQRKIKISRPNYSRSRSAPGLKVKA